MKNEKIYSALYDYCRWNQSENVISILQDNPRDVDITYNDGIFFRLAASQGSIKILNALLHYFETISIDDYDTSKYQLKKFQLQNILKATVDEFDLSNEIQDLLKPYLSSNNNSGDNTDEDSEFETNPFSSDEDISYIQNEGFDKDISLIGSGTDFFIY